MAVRTFSETTAMDRCTYDNSLEMVNGRVRLKSHLLVADDIGSITSRTFELIHGNTKARKSLMLGVADAKEAELVLRIEPVTANPSEGSENTLQIQINRTTISHSYSKENQSFQGDIDAYWSMGWEVIQIPPKALKAGLNKIIISDGGGSGWRLFITE